MCKAILQGDEGHCWFHLPLPQVLSGEAAPEGAAEERAERPLGSVALCECGNQALEPSNRTHWRPSCDGHWLLCLQIPHNTLLMYLHSYQSLIWNKMVSWRLSECGLTPVVGDLVRKNGRAEKVELNTLQNVLHHLLAFSKLR